MVAQIISVIIFIAMFVLIVIDKIERQWVTLGCGALMILIVFGVCMQDFSAVIKTLNVHSIFIGDFWIQLGSAEETSSGINWATIIFITGMMVMVEGMAEVGFFRWLCLNIAKLVRYRTIPILITFMIMSSLLAMFIDSITVILFLAAVTVELARLLKFSPVPMIIAEVFCANLGGSATMCGDPPNIIIGTSLGLSFGDFISNTGVIALISLIFAILYFYLCFRKQYKQSAQNTQAISYPDPKEAITDKRGFILSTIIFICAIVMLVTHAQTGLTVAFIGAVIAVVTLLASGKKYLTLIKRIDYKTLLFFVGLFIVVGGLEQTGVLEIIAGFIGTISNGNAVLMVTIILWLSAIASAFVDNIPFAATMLPIIKSLSATTGVDVSVLAWTLSLGADIGGSATPIGASANVVGISVASKEGYPIGWGRYCKYSVPATFIVIAICMVCLLVRYPL